MVTLTASQPISENNRQIEAARPTTGCQCNCAEMFKDWESKKNRKLKLKLLEERKKMKWMQGIIILVILYVAFQKFGLA